MSTRKMITGWALVSMISLTSCASTDVTGSPRSKTQEGAVTGAVIGGLVGALLGKKNRAAGAAIGAVAGGGIGYLIGRELDQRDQAKLQAKVDEAAEKNRSNQTTVWKSDHSGASATITPVEEARPVEVTKSVSKARDVVLYPAPLKMAAGSRVATSDVNLRYGPNTQYGVREVLRKGQAVDVIGMTDTGWYLIAEGNTAIGYVSGRYLVKPGYAEHRARRSVPAPAETSPQPPQAVQTETRAPQGKQVEEVDIRMVGVCRPVRVRIRDPKGGIREDTVTTCQNPDGSWGA